MGMKEFLDGIRGREARIETQGRTILIQTLLNRCVRGRSLDAAKVDHRDARGHERAS